MITLEVQRVGEKSRLFSFEETELVIGSTDRCHLLLDGRTESELVLMNSPSAPAFLRAAADPKSFLLNGAQCSNDTPLKKGDVITTDSYRIIIRDLTRDFPPPTPDQTADPVKEEVAAEPFTTDKSAHVEAAPPAPEPARVEAEEEPQSEAAPEPQPKGGLSYLLLFFAPVQQYLADDDVAEIMINGPSKIYIERRGKLIQVPEKFSSDQALQAAVINVARSVGRLFDRSNPRLDARLPDGSRVHAVMPPLSRAGTVVAIRKFRREKLTIEQLIQYGSITSEGARLLEIIVRLGKNLIVSGATSSGKTSVLNVLSSFIPENERILVLEDASELQLQQPHIVAFETRKADEHGKGEVTIRDLLHSALRLRPDRIVVGEIRGGEALDLLQAMNTGHDGSMSTIHANTPRDSLSRLETCALLGGLEIPLAVLREQVAASIHVVIQTARLHDGSRRITSVAEVLGLQDREYKLQELFVYRQEQVEGGHSRGRHVFTGNQPTFLASAKNRGFNVSGLWGAA